MSIQHKLFHNPLGIITLLGLACIITAYIVALVDNTDEWPLLCIVVGGLFNLGGFLTGSTALYIAGAGCITSLLALDTVNFHYGGNGKNTAQAALFLIGSVLTFVGYPFKVPKSLKIEPFTIIALLGISCNIAAAIVTWSVKPLLNPGLFELMMPGITYVFIVVAFVWGAFGGSSAAQYLTIFLGFSLSSRCLLTLSSDNAAGTFLERTPAETAAIALGLSGSTIMAGLTTFLLSQARQSDEEAPLLRG